MGTVWQIDSSKHEVRFVTVEPGVRLEVLDWGGNGLPVVLLTELGDNAHVLDHFAEKLTHKYHVYGITRRALVCQTHRHFGETPIPRTDSATMS